MRIDRKFKALASFALAVVLGGLGVLEVAQAQSGAQSGGSAGVQSGKGFGCMPGFQWKMFPDGVARCTSTAAPRAIAATSCAAAPSYTTDKTGSCTFNLPATAGGAIASARNSNTESFTGALTIECSAGGQWTNPIGSCVEVPRITSFNRSASSVLIGDGVSVSWTSSGATAANLVCSGANNSSAANLGANSNRGLSTANEGSTTCTLTVTGPGGTSAPASLTWSARGPLDCSATSISPGVCRYPIPALASGQSQVASTNTAGYAGAVTATCNDGTWSYSGATCAAQTNPCAATTVTHGSCLFSVPKLDHQQGRNVYNERSGYYGVLGAICNNGTLTYFDQFCEVDAPPADCSSSSTSYGSCAFSVPALSHGASRAVADSTAGYTGSLTATCNNGTLSYSGRTCTQDVAAPVGCSASNTTFGSCSFSVPAIAHGGSSVVNDSTAGYTGALTATCNNGTLSYSGRTCTQDVAAPVGCSATSTTYGSCGFSVPAIAHGGSATVNDLTAGYTGQVTASCSNGTLSYSGRTCAQDVAAPVGCSATSTTYGSCSFSVPAIAHGNSAAVNDSTAGYTGQVTASCNNGTLSYSGQSCTADLKVPVASVSLSKSTVRDDESFTASWSGTNSPTYYWAFHENKGAVKSWTGAPRDLGITPGAYTVVVYACNDAGCSDAATATLNVTSAVKIPVASVSVSKTTLGEDETLTASWSGTNSPDYYWVWGQNQGKATSWTGTPRQLGITPGDYMLYAFACNAAGCSDAATKLITVTAPANCLATTTTYGSCGFSVPSLAHGNSEAVPDSTPGYTGQVTASCNNGKVSFSGQSCTADPKVPVASLSLSPNSVREDVSFTASWSGTNSPTYYEVIGVNMGLTTSWSGTPISLGLKPGDHTISVIACNAAGCSLPTSKTLTVKQGANQTPACIFWDERTGEVPLAIGTARGGDEYRYSAGNQWCDSSPAGGAWCQTRGGGYGGPAFEYACWSRPPVDCLHPTSGNIIWDGTGRKEWYETSFWYCKNGALQRTSYYGPNPQGL